MSSPGKRIRTGSKYPVNF